MPKYLMIWKRLLNIIGKYKLVSLKGVALWSTESLQHAFNSLSI